MFDLDATVLSKVQKLCDKFTEFTGRTKYFLEKWVVISATAIIDFPLLHEPAIVGAVLLTANSIALVFFIEGRERAFLQDPGAIPLTTLRDPQFRCVLAASYIFVGVDALFLVPKETGHYFFVGTLFMALAVYIGGCLPKPPTKSKFRQWYEQGLTWLNEKLKPAPELIPIPSR